MAGAEQEVLVVPRLEQSKSEQRSGERHRGSLDGRRDLASFLRRVLRISQVIELKREIRVIERLLEDLSIGLDEGRTQRFGLLQHSAYRPLKGITFNRTLDLGKQTELPLLSTGVAGSPRKPDIKLWVCDGQGQFIKLHCSPTQD
nr:hypothetical protein [Mycolicibacterium confluentis]